MSKLRRFTLLEKPRAETAQGGVSRATLDRFEASPSPSPSPQRPAPPDTAAPAATVDVEDLRAAARARVEAFEISTLLGDRDAEPPGVRLLRAVPSQRARVGIVVGLVGATVVFFAAWGLSPGPVLWTGIVLSLFSARRRRRWWRR